jgi:uncharacterized phage protein gp47/JayE
MLTTDMTEVQAIARARELFRAHIPESNAWLEPSHLSIVATVIGGMGWSILQEARNGLEARAMPDTAQGQYLDAIAARPPFNTLRRAATNATGPLSVAFTISQSIAVDDIFTRSDGIKYAALCAFTGTAGQIQVRAVDPGTIGNAASGMPLTDARGTVTSMGIVGGYGIETEAELRDRMYRVVQAGYFGSVGSIEAMVESVHGVGKASACGGDCGRVSVFVAMQDNIIPTDADLQWILQWIEGAFADPCAMPAHVCVDILPAVSRTLVVKVSEACGVDVAAVLRIKLLPGLAIGQTVTAADVVAVLASSGVNVSVVSVAGNPGDGGLWTDIQVLQ